MRLPRRVGDRGGARHDPPGQGGARQGGAQDGAGRRAGPDARFLHHVREFALERRDTRRPPAATARTSRSSSSSATRSAAGSSSTRRARRRSGDPGPIPGAAARHRGGAGRASSSGRAAGFAAEARAIGELAAAEVSKNLIHIFRLMEAAKKARRCPRARGSTARGALAGGARGRRHGRRHRPPGRRRRPACRCGCATSSRRRSPSGLDARRRALRASRSSGAG